MVAGHSSEGVLDVMVPGDAMSTWEMLSGMVGGGGGGGGGSRREEEG